MNEQPITRRPPGRWLRGAWRRRLGAALLCLPATGALALPQDQTMEQLHRTHWSLREGAPGLIAAIAQTRDGYLWLGGGSGLVRFDGARFQPYETAPAPAPAQALTSLSIMALQALPDGGLAIGYRFGGVSILQPDGRMRHAGPNEGLPAGLVRRFALDPSGGLWAATSAGLMREQQGRWSRIGPEQGLDARLAVDLLFDRRGALWVATEAGVFHRAPDEPGFRRVAERLQLHRSSLALAPDDRVWAYSYDDDSHVGPLPRPGEPLAPLLPAWRDVHPNVAMRFDRDGALWVFTDDGTQRIAHPERPVRPDEGEFAASLGNRTQGSLQGFEDREGNLWVGSVDGLDRFRANKLDVISLWPGPKLVGVAPADEGIWSVQWSHGPSLLSPGQRQPVEVTVPRAANHSTAVHRDAAGRLWFGSWSGLWRVDRPGAPVVQDRLPPGVGEGNGGSTTDSLQAMTVDAAGGLWISVQRRGVYYRPAGGAWQAMAGQREILPVAPQMLQGDPAGRVWLGYTQNRLLRLDGPDLTRGRFIAGLRVGNVLAVLPLGEQTWVAGDAGLAMVDGAGTAHALRVEGGRSLLGLSGLAMTTEGDLWLNGTAGIVRVPAGELAAALRDPAHELRVDHFDHRDGVPGPPTDQLPLPTVVQSADGRLWFALSNGVVTLHPKHIPSNPMPPPVAIEAVRAQDRQYPATQGLSLPERSRDVQIEYTALSLTMPERVRFRYRLDGVDQAWQEAGARRTAFYTQLGPGDYVFRVSASNNDGVWNEEGASLRFSIAPAFYQTRWFLALCLAVLLVALWGLHQMRLRQVAARVRGRLEARLLERERIARELHDTLLQGFHGLMLRFQAATERIPGDTPARAQMEAALDRADAVLVEGRQRVLDLRADDRQPLGEALAEAGEALSLYRPGSFCLKQEGAARALRPEVGEAFLRVGQEALANAYKHSRAARIELTLCYGDEALCLSVKDDGQGIDPQVLAAGERPGHWGLTGMRERADELGATLSLDSGPAIGTTLVLRLPAASAYARDEPPRRRLRWIRKEKREEREKREKECET